MSLVIRIPLKAEGVNVLAGYATHGPTITALYGLVSRLEDAASMTVNRFGLVVTSYKPRLFEQQTNSLDVILKGKQALPRSSTPNRAGDLQAALYLDLDEDLVDDPDVLMEVIARAMNCSRYQGGHFTELFGTQPTDEARITYQVDETVFALTTLMEQETPLAQVYQSCHLPTALQGAELIEAFAQGIAAGALMVCNGFHLAGEVPCSQTHMQKVGEPLFTLATTKPVYEVLRLDPEEQEDALETFWWQFKPETDSHFTLI